MEQILIRNGKTGYEVRASSYAAGAIPFQLVALSMPNIHTEHQYFAKILFENYVIVKLVTPDGFDDYGRLVMRCYALIIDQEAYSKDGLVYYLSPLINGKITRKNDLLLRKADFSVIDLRSLSSDREIVQDVAMVLQKNNYTLPLGSSGVDDFLRLAMIDSVIPVPWRFSFSILSYVSPSHSNLKQQISLTCADDGKRSLCDSIPELITELVVATLDMDHKDQYTKIQQRVLTFQFDKKDWLYGQKVKKRWSQQPKLSERVKTKIFKRWNAWNAVKEHNADESDDNSDDD